MRIKLSYNRIQIYENQSDLSSSLLNWKKSFKFSEIAVLDSFSISSSEMTSSLSFISFFDAYPSRAESLSLFLHIFFNSSELDA